MKRRTLSALAVTAIMGALGLAPPGLSAAPTLMTPAEIVALRSEPPDHRLSYGPAPSQFGELRLPEGLGPHPVVVLIHGGCWQTLATQRFMAPMADALKREGIATWNIEYRRLGEPGGGWPGTYRDVGAAIDHLRDLAPVHRLDLSRVVVLGHSAGGHLAHWAAARGHLDAKSAVHMPNPLLPHAIVNLAGRIDMSAGIEAYETLCRDRVVTSLLGGSPESVPARYRDASPSALLPLGVRQTLIWGEHEEFVPEPLARRFVSAARQAGDQADLIVVPGAGHFETASPASHTWPTILATIQSLLGKE